MRFTQMMVISNRLALDAQSERIVLIEMPPNDLSTLQTNRPFVKHFLQVLVILPFYQPEDIDLSGLILHICHIGNLYKL